MVKTRKLVLAALVFAVLNPVAHAGVREAAHTVKEDAKGAGRKIGQGAREFGHATADVSRKAGHAVANTARNGYHATKEAIHKAVGKSDEKTANSHNAS